MSDSSNQPVTPNPEEEVQTAAVAEAEAPSEKKQPAAKAKKEKKAVKTDLFADEEKVVDITELTEEQEYDEEEYNNFMQLYDNTIAEFVEGELVTGKILAIGESEVAVDIGFKSEGVIPIEEFSNPEELKIGDEIEVFLDTVEDTDGQLVLSKKKADFMKVWEKIIDSHARGEVLRGTCVRRIKGGIVVDLMGVDAFLPGSQIDVRPIRDFDAYIGRELDFRIVKVNELRKNIVVSHRVLVEETLKEQRQKILDNLEKGQVLEGTVKNITDFGVFIDLGGVDGLLHINDLSWGRVSHPSEIVSLDDKIKVQVLDFNEAKDRISLGLKQLQPHPWIDVDKKYPVGSTVTGKVVSISDYGAFVEIEKGVEGLIHISEMSWTQHIRHPSKVVSIGETIEAKVLNLDVEGRKISLGLKQLEPDPWDQIEERYPVGSTQHGVVRNLTNFGAFVELEEGIDGLVHISDLSWTKKIRHPGEVLKKGDEVDVIVLNVDKANRRISLGYKQTRENPWDTFTERYAVGTETTGKIVRMIDKGVITELPDDVDGFVPISHLVKDNINKPSDGYAVGDTLNLVVIEFNAENKKIILSEKLAHEKGEAADKEAKAEKAEAEKAEAEKAEAEKAEAAEAAQEAAAEETAEAAVEETQPEAEAAAEEAPAAEEASEEAAEEKAAEDAEASAGDEEEKKES